VEGAIKKAESAGDGGSVDKIKRKALLRGKISAVGRMNRMFVNLREN